MQAILNKKHTTTNELQTILAGAAQISREHHLKEVCTEALLYVIIENEAIKAGLLKQGLNVFMFQRLLAKKLAGKAVDNPPAEPPYSVALDGLLILNKMEKGANSGGMHLLKTIVKYKNTAAARMLAIEHISINEFNELTYKPINQ